MKRSVVFVAGGSGSRMKSAIPKQFLLLDTKPVLMHAIQKFYTYNPLLHLIVVLPETQIEEWKKLCSMHQFEIKHQLIGGGATRFESVKNGLTLLEEEGLVAVHDGVRPLVSEATIATVFAVAAEKGNAVPCIPLNDSIRKLVGDKNEMQARENFRLLQTPQCFTISLLKKAFAQPYQEWFTDCASVFEAAGGSINLVDGNVENIKITTASDLKIAVCLL